MKSFPMLFQKTATGAISYWQVWAEGGYVFTQWGQIGTESPQEQVYATAPTNVGRANERGAGAQAEFEAEALWKKKRRLKYFESQEEALGELNLKPLLAQEYTKRKKHIQFPVDVQPKYDGFRCLAFRSGSDMVLMSRGGKFYTAGHVSAELRAIPGAIKLDGELYIHGESLQNIASLIKRPRPESVAVQYHIYDCTYGNNEPWSTRREMLVQVASWLQGAQYIRMVETIQAGTDELVHQLHDVFVNDGYEGAIIRTMDHEYRFGYRSPGLLKLKNFEDKEFPIVDWTTDKDDTLMWIVSQEEGLQFPVRPMGTEEHRQELLAHADQYIGRPLTVRFQGRTDANIPKFARGVHVREDWDV